MIHVCRQKCSLNTIVCDCTKLAINIIDRQNSHAMPLSLGVDLFRIVQPNTGPVPCDCCNRYPCGTAITAMRSC